MADWITRYRYRFLIVVCVYFALHVALRAVVSGSLDFDESEQAFLSQWTLMGYNSQPPLYTWMQKSLFSLFGYNPFALALLKNVLLVLTYLAVYGIVRKETLDTRQAVVASLGMLMIPQIAWESHRDLSHTVAVTFATVALIYCVVSLGKDRRTRWYIAIGLICAFGMLSKYNFAIIILAVSAAVLTIPFYRRNLLDYRIGWSLAIATVLIAPHVHWMIHHSGLASQKTIQTLSQDSTQSYLQNVSIGMSSLFGSAFVSCCLLCLFLFAVAYRSSLWQRLKQVSKSYQKRLSPVPIQTVVEETSAAADTTKLIGRIFLVVTAILILIVLSGSVLEFRNRWIQPFVCLLPAYLVLRFRDAGLVDRVAMNRLALTSFALMIVILTAVVSRPILAPRYEDYSLLNIPFKSFCETIGQRGAAQPDLILASNVRIAGNVKRYFPEALVLSLDTDYVPENDSIIKSFQKGTHRIVVVTDPSVLMSQEELELLTDKIIRRPEMTFHWESMERPYYYDKIGRQAAFSFACLEESPYDSGELPAIVSASDWPADSETPYLTEQPTDSKVFIK